MMRFKVYYYDEKLDMNKFRHFQNLEEFDRWLDRMSKTTVVEILGIEVE